MGKVEPFTIGEPDHLKRIHMMLALQDSGFVVVEAEDGLFILEGSILEPDWRALIRQRSGSGVASS
jgi:hypothetical protein